METHQVPYSFLSCHFAHSAGLRTRTRRGPEPHCSSHTQPGLRKGFPSQRRTPTRPDGLSPLRHCPRKRVSLRAAENASKELDRDMAL